jgi:hypothetical protein
MMLKKIVSVGTVKKVLAIVKKVVNVAVITLKKIVYVETAKQENVIAIIK